MQVVLDRRVADRRRGGQQRVPERRRTDRRAPAVHILAKLWLQGYAVVHVEDQPAELTPTLTMSHRGYQVEARSEQLPTGEWRPTAVVISQTGNIVRISPLEGEKRHTFPTRDEADRYALEMATKWLGD